MNIHKFLIEHMLYPAMELKNGNRIRKKLRTLQKTEAFSAETLKRKQMDELKSLLHHCIKHVPAYQKYLYLDSRVPTDPLACLQTLPPLSKKEFQNHAEDYIADDLPESDRIPNQTGGSTGEPVHFFMNRDQVEWYEAARWRGLSWYGITPGSRCLMIWASPIELAHSAQKRYLLRERLLKNRQILSAYSLSEHRVPEYIRLINRYRPEYLYGYASALAELARLLQPSHEKLRIQLKAVVSTTETLFPWQKALLEEVFSCPVVNEYGARDAGILAYSCPCGNLHLTAENAIVEVLDPTTRTPVSPGVPGVLAITDLHNRIQPRLRYLLGDVGAVSENRCPCGRGLPLLEVLEGREDALLVGQDGELVHGNVIGQIIRQYSCVSQFQFVQHSIDRATLFLEMQPDEAIVSEITAAIQKILPNILITTQLVDQIAPASSGKMRYSIREFQLSEDSVHPQ